MKGKNNRWISILTIIALLFSMMNGCLIDTWADSEAVNVNIAVVGMYGEVLFQPQSVEITKENPNAEDVLKATGLNAEILEDEGKAGWIESIEGQKNGAADGYYTKNSGWMYKVNAILPGDVARKQTVKGGDYVFFFYVKDSQDLHPSYYSGENDFINVNVRSVGEAENFSESITVLKGKSTLGAVLVAFKKKNIAVNKSSISTGMLMTSDQTKIWDYMVNDEPSTLNNMETTLNADDIITVYQNDTVHSFARVTLDKNEIAAGENVTATVEKISQNEYGDNIYSPAKGAKVHFGADEATADDSGKAVFKAAATGEISVYADGADIIATEKQNLKVKAAAPAGAKVIITSPATMTESGQAYAYSTKINAAADIKDASGNSVTTGIEWYYTKGSPLGAVEKINSTTNSISFTPKKLNGALSGGVYKIYLYASYTDSATKEKVTSEPVLLYVNTVKKLTFSSSLGFSNLQQKVNVYFETSEVLSNTTATVYLFDSAKNEIVKADNQDVKSISDISSAKTTASLTIPGGVAEGTYDIYLEIGSKSEPNAEKYRAHNTYKVYKSIDELLSEVIDKAGTAALTNHNSMDWVAIGLARGGKEVPASYLASVAAALNDNYNQTSKFKTTPTEFERMTLGVLAAGGDPTNIGGYNMIKQIYTADLEAQGVNALVFGLIALDAGNYDVPSDARWTREKLIKAILDKECGNGGTEYNKKGGWAFGPGGPNAKGDPDMSGMTMTALAPYYNKKSDVKEAVDRAVDYLSSIQNDAGGYASWGTVNSESCAQVIMGLCANGIDPTGARFTKNGGNLIQAILGFWAEDGGFKHIMDYGTNGMATEQALYALDQYKYFIEGKGLIYNWGDKENSGEKTVNVRIEGKNGLIIPGKEIKISGNPTVKETVLKALAAESKVCAENSTGFDSIDGNSSSSGEKWMFSVEDGLPLSDFTSRKIHNCETIIVYIGKDSADYTHSWLEIPSRTSCGLQTSIFKPHEAKAFSGSDIEIIAQGNVYDGAASSYSVKPIADAMVYIDGLEYKKNDAAVLTNADGKALVNISKAGVHEITIRKDNVKSAYFIVNVEGDTEAPQVTFSMHFPSEIKQGSPDTIEFFYITPSDNKDDAKDIAMVVKLNGNALNPSEVGSNGSRKYTKVSFDKYKNILTVEVEDKSGNKATITKEVINQNKPANGDTKAPVITVNGLTDGMNAAGNKLKFTVAVNDEKDGAVAPVVKLKDKVINPGQDGSYTVELSEGNNLITVTAVDKAGNKAEKTFNIKMAVFVIKRIGDGSFKNGDEAIVKVELANTASIDKEATLIVALYDADKNKLINYNYVRKAIKAGISEELCGAFLIPETGNYKVRSFIWDNVQDMNIISENPIVIDVNKN